MVVKDYIDIQFQPNHFIHLIGFDEYSDDLRQILADQFANAFKEAAEKLDPKCRLDEIMFNIDICNSRKLAFEVGSEEMYA